MESRGFEGATTRRVALSIACRAAALGRAVSRPVTVIAVTVTSWRRRTKYSWKAIGPSSVSRVVATGSSLAGNTVARTPRRWAISAVTSVLVAPSPRRWVR